MPDGRLQNCPLWTPYIAGESVDVKYYCFRILYRQAQLYQVRVGTSIPLERYLVCGWSWRGASGVEAVFSTTFGIVSQFYLALLELTWFYWSLLDFRGVYVILLDFT